MFPCGSTVALPGFPATLWSSALCPVQGAHSACVRACQLRAWMQTLVRGARTPACIGDRCVGMAGSKRLKCVLNLSSALQKVLALATIAVCCRLLGCGMSAAATTSVAANPAAVFGGASGEEEDGGGAPAAVWLRASSPSARRPQRLDALERLPHALAASLEVLLGPRLKGSADCGPPAAAATPVFAATPVAAAAGAAAEEVAVLPQQKGNPGNSFGRRLLLMRVACSAEWQRRAWTQRSHPAAHCLSSGTGSPLLAMLLLLSGQQPSALGLLGAQAPAATEAAPAVTGAALLPVDGSAALHQSAAVGLPSYSHVRGIRQVFGASTLPVNRPFTGFPADVEIIGLLALALTQQQNNVGRDTSANSGLATTFRGVTFPFGVSFATTNSFGGAVQQAFDFATATDQRGAAADGLETGRAIGSVPFGDVNVVTNVLSSALSQRRLLLDEYAYWNGYMGTIYNVEYDVAAAADAARDPHHAYEYDDTEPQDQQRTGGAEGQQLQSQMSSNAGAGNGTNGTSSGAGRGGVNQYLYDPFDVLLAATLEYGRAGQYSYFYTDYYRFLSTYYSGPVIVPQTALGRTRSTSAVVRDDTATTAGSTKNAATGLNVATVVQSVSAAIRGISQSLRQSDILGNSTFTGAPQQPTRQAGVLAGGLTFGRGYFFQAPSESFTKAATTSSIGVGGAVTAGAAGSVTGYGAGTKFSGARSQISAQTGEENLDFDLGG
eukprot:XP_001697568.1 predicted protein [Chlamydomonas reinhardtii]